jgi:hypothetical protein
VKNWGEMETKKNQLAHQEWQMEGFLQIIDPSVYQIPLCTRFKVLCRQIATNIDNILSTMVKIL